MDITKPHKLPVGKTVKDPQVQGLSLRRNAGGYSWMLYYRTRSGVERRPKLGDYPTLQLKQAREIARELLARVALGEDPAGVWRAERDFVTVEELFERYTKEHAHKLRSWRTYTSCLNRYILPTLGKKRVDTVTQEDVQALHTRVSRKAPIMANRVVAILSSMFNKAEAWNLKPRDTNPCRYVSKNREYQRERYMRPEEATRIAEAFAILPPLTQATIKLLMMTGARRGELAGRVLEREGNVLKVRGHKTAKRRDEVKYVRLPDVAVELIEREGLDGVRLPSGQALRYAWQRVTTKAGVEDLKLHDLRHTFASVGLSAGVKLGVIGALLGHSNPNMTARYAHLVDDAGEQAVNLVGDAVSKMMETQDGSS